MRLLIAASGTGGHLFPAIALAEQLPDMEIEWLGVPNRLETQLVPARYPLHTVAVEGFQQPLGVGSIAIVLRLAQSIWQVRKLLQEGKFDGVFTTGGYIAAPAIIAARSLSLPIIFHESNALPGKVARWFSRWCNVAALGFEAAEEYFPPIQTAYLGTPVRTQFRTPQKLDLPLPTDVPLIVITGGSQGAVAINQLIRQCAPQWLAAGAWIFHQTGDKDPDVDSLQHPHYIAQPFYDNMAGLFQRANLAISRAGAGTLTELAVTHTPAILIPYPYAAENHQAFNADVFVKAGAALVFNQSELTASRLESKVLELVRSPDLLAQMSAKAAALAIPDSAERLAVLVQQLLTVGNRESG